MGNNQAYTDFEFFTMACYDAGILTPKLLKKFIHHYDGTDIDSGGSHNLIAYDGKEIEDVVISIMGGRVLEKPKKTFSFNNELVKYYEQRYDQFHKYTKGWR